jgi:hypothetical protein
MSNDITSPLESETTHETTTFDHFGRSWSVPTQRHLSHLKGLQHGFRQPAADPDVVVAEVMLGAEQFEALFDIDPSESELSEFVTAIAKAMGLGSSGNSGPSSPSS